MLFVTLLGAIWTSIVFALPIKQTNKREAGKVNREGAVVGLRLLEPSDAEELFGLIERNKEYLSRFVRVGREYLTLQSVRYRIASSPADERMYAMIVGEPPAIIGCVELKTKSPTVAEIECWLGEKYANRGYATMAVAIVTRLALDVLGFARVVAHVDLQNSPSIAVLRRNGFDSRIDQSHPNMLLLGFPDLPGLL